MADKLTRKQKKILTEVFALFDYNGDGIISVEELEKVMRSLGLRPTKRELHEILDEVDLDCSGAIDFDEFLTVMAKRLALEAVKEKEDELVNAFKRFDRDKRGYIFAEDLRLVLTNLGNKLTAKEADQMVKHTNKKGDGKIYYSEFVALLKS